MKLQQSIQAELTPLKDPAAAKMPPSQAALAAYSQLLES